MSSNIIINRICIFCNSEFEARTTSTKYCSHKCNSKHYKAKIRAKKVEQSIKETKQVKIKSIQDIEQKDILTVKEVSILLGCSIRSTYRLIENGTLKAVNLSERMTRINKNELYKVLKKETSQPIIEEVKPTYRITKPKPIQVEINDCYTITEVQDKFKVSEKALYDIVKRNDIPKMKQGRYSYVPKVLIDKLFT